MNIPKTFSWVYLSKLFEYLGGSSCEGGIVGFSAKQRRTNEELFCVIRIKSSYVSNLANKLVSLVLVLLFLRLNLGSSKAKPKSSPEIKLLSSIVSVLDGTVIEVREFWTK